MKYDEQLYLCANCAKDHNLAQYIELNGVKSVKCCICKSSENKSVIISGNNIVHNIFKALVRYYFTEDQYNGHWGGDDLYKLFEIENPIIKHDIIFENPSGDDDELTIDLIIDELTNPVYEDYDKGVSIFLGREYGYYADTIPDTKSSILKEYEQKIKQYNHYELESDAIDLIAPYKDFLKYEISVNGIFCRSRIGFSSRHHKSKDPLQKSQVVYFPHMENGIGAPPPPFASNGRINRQGVSYLYLANSLETAICEIKPHPGQIVSIAEFTPKRNMVFVDLKEVQFSNYWLTEKGINTYIFLKDLNTMFATPVAPSESLDTYFVTQFFANTFRLMGFDGIAFKSSVSNGANFVAFNPRDFEYRKNSAICKKIMSLRYGFDDVFYELEQDSDPNVDYFPKIS